MLTYFPITVSYDRKNVYKIGPLVGRTFELNLKLKASGGNWPLEL